MKRATAGISVVLAIVFTTGCGNGSAPAGGTVSSPLSAGSASSVVAPSSQTPEDSIRTAIQAHLAHRGNLNLQSFDTQVKQVNIRGDHAQADVEFHVKGGPGVMQLTYQLEKRDNAWSVLESVPASSNFSHPPLDGSVTNTDAPSSSANPLSDPTGFFNGATAK
jgi:hypothetical protein